MNTGKMFSVGQIVKLPEKMELSDVMYEMKSCYKLPDNIKETYYHDQEPCFKHSVSKISESSHEMMNVNTLKQRQLTILEKLKHMKKKLDFLVAGKQIVSISGSDDASSFNSLKNGAIHDMVVSANPSSPPYFLLPIKRMLRPVIRILSTCTTHSSINKVDKNILRLFRDDEMKDRSSYDLAFTVLWKDVASKRLMVNPLSQSVISGEANILRYISRLAPSTSPLCYESKGDISSVSQTDYWLDTIQSKFLHGSNKERQAFLRQLNYRLESEEWVSGKITLGIIDIFSWSAIVQLGLRDSLPNNVSSWFQRFTEAVEIEIIYTHKPPSRTPDRCTGCPYFLETRQHILTGIGDQVNLTCGVRHLGDRQVSWIRKKDLHVLTTDGFTYTTDSRFRVHHKANSPYWVLVIEDSRVEDSAIYECQVSTQPKISMSFTLSVVVPHAKIKGTSEMFMKAGSDINITCIISGVTNPSYVTWFHITPSSPGKENVEVLNAGGRGGVQLVTDKRSGYSWLLVTSATWRDAGNYTCAPAHATPATVTVHVLDEGTPAAMQRDLPSSGSPVATTPLNSPLCFSEDKSIVSSPSHRRKNAAFSVLCFISPGSIYLLLVVLIFYKSFPP